MTDKDKMDQLGKLHQMKINTRLTALQAAQTLMQTPGYLGVEGMNPETNTPAWVHKPNAVDHLTLLAMASDIELYILGQIEAETKQAMEEMNKPPSQILKVRP